MLLIRTEQTGNCTRGVLVFPSAVFHTLELPWRDNERAVSCIPVGTYESIYLSQSSSRKYKSVYHLRSVPGRSGILIHNGNIVEHTDGCILIGLYDGFLKGEPAVLDSRNALKRLNRILGEQNFDLEII
jgi:hypothetical protein